MLRPATAYQELGALPDAGGKWCAVRRPLFFAFIIGCGISFITSQRLSLRLVADGFINVNILLLGQIGVLAIVLGRKRTIPFSRAVDLFFAGYGPWSLWFFCYSTLWAFAPPLEASTWAASRAMFLAAIPVAIWSAYIDYCLFHHVIQWTPKQIVRPLLLQWLLSWILTIFIFGGGPLGSEQTRMFSR
jgi:hypothetical protein